MVVKEYYDEMMNLAFQTVRYSKFRLTSSYLLPSTSMEMNIGE